MGYTHYWGFGPFITESAYKKALTECRKLVRATPVGLGNAYGKGQPKLNHGVWFNGVGDDAHETFALPKIPKSDFCKTARKPYDLIVVACLCVLKDNLGKSVTVRSDGDPHEWELGREFASKVLGRQITIPQGVLDQESYYGWYARRYRREHPEYDYTPLDKTHPDWRNEDVPEYAKE
jgi:hypothetical protein